MKRLVPLIVIALGVTAVAVAQVKRTAAPAAAEVYFIAPKDGESVSSPVTVRFGLKGMGVAPAGVAFEGAGHHHLVVDAPTPPLDAPVPADAKHLHFGKGQTETTLELKPGKHTLQLIVGDQLHIPHQPAVVSKVITVTVK
ncbi:MAG TPA: DUF4399 domain-containing protein [Steroidobacteraceae bacterium]|nr:DUF4399 domain-containing protein [Steroidobacteraceae bacterium]